MSAVIQIHGFRGQHGFLSNFYPAPITVGGLYFPTSEHVYQAYKTNDPQEREFVREAGTPGESKRRGKKITIRKDWNDVKLEMMRAILVHKFTQNLELAERLLATEDAELVESNTWGDRFWGVCEGKGENHLGKLLMEVRQQLREAREVSANG